MKFKALLFISGYTVAVLLFNSVNCENDEQTRQGRILNNRKNYDTAIEQQLIQEYPTQNATEATADELIDEIIDSSRQGRNVEGLEAIYDLNINEALNNGNENEARNLIRDKLCDLGLMQCDELIPKRPQYPTRVIYTQPPPGAQIYSNRPMQQPQYNNVRPPIQSVPQKSGQIYGPAKPMPLPHVPQNQPPRKIGFASELNSYESSSNKFNNYYERDPNPSSIKFGYTEKPTIVVNQGKREASNGLVQNHHVHHHYVHVDGNSNGGLVDGSKTVLVNTPISEYSAVDSLSSSYQTSGFGTSGASSNLNGFTPMSATNNYEYKGVNSGQSSYQGLNSGNYQGIKPVYEGSNQYATGTNYNKYTQVAGPAVYTEGSNGVYNPSSSQHAVQGSFHATSPEFHKKELNLNGYRGNGLTGSGYASQQQQPPNSFHNSQKVQQQQQHNSLYSKNPYAQNQGQDQSDCVCVPFDQCPAQDIVGRRDDLVLPLDPRNLPTEIEAAESDNNSTTVKSANVTIIETKKISKRAVDDVQKVQGEGRIGFGGGAGYYPQGGYPGKKILPTVGVSFGLPFPTGQYPISPYAPYAPNAHFGAISPNGLNLGLLNVNPLFSLQVTKNELGEKLVKPLVNLHVTPNENIIGKIGNLFLAKKGQFHNHYHNHLHRYPPPPIYHGDDHHHFQPHHIEGPPPFISSFPPNGQIFDGPPPHHHHHHNEGPPHHFLSKPPIFDGPIHTGPPPHLIFSKPPPHFLKSSGEFSKDTFFDDINPSSVGFRSSNISLDDYNYQSIYPEKNFNGPQKEDSRYAREFSNYNTYSLSTQAPGTSEGSEKVSFPTSRRRRDTDQPVPASVEEKHGDHESSIESEDSEGRAINTNKRQAFYQPQKQCGPRAVCCRRPFIKPAPVQYNRCGVRSAQGINGRIKNPVYVDGNSEFGEWPWQAAILKKDPKESVYVCGGTLISDSYVITAVHCIKSYNGFDLRVRLGEWDVNHDVEFYPYVEKDVISVHVHPDYYAGTLDNDIAILKLSSPIDLNANPHITPACLPDRLADFSGTRCWTTGWGKDNWEYGKYQNILKEVDVPVIDQNTCQQQLRQTRLGYSYNLNPGFMCAGGEEGKDACKGDGGGPLVCERNGVWSVAGIVSWGIGCGQQNVPGVYVRVSHYLNWIQQITRY